MQAHNHVIRMFVAIERGIAFANWEVGVACPEVASFMIDWGQLRNPRAVVRGEKDPCFGTLSLSGTRLRFDSLSSNDSFTTELSNIDKVEINRNRIAGETAFQVKIHKGKNYNFVPRQSVQSVVGSIRSAMSR